MMKWNTSMKWNEQIKYERETRGWPQRLLAKKIGTSAFTVSRWETGAAFPSPFYRQELSRVFGKSLEELGLVQLVPHMARGRNKTSHIISDFSQLPEYQRSTSTEQDEIEPFSSDDLQSMLEPWPLTSPEQNEAHRILGSQLVQGDPRAISSQESEPSGDLPDSSQEFSHVQKRRRLLKALGIGIAAIAVGGSSIVWLARVREPQQKAIYKGRPIRVVSVYRGHSARVTEVTWSPDNTSIASSSWDTTVQVWDARDVQHAAIYHGHAAQPVQAWAVAWSPDGGRLASGYRDGSIEVWDAQSCRLIHIYRGHSGSVEALAWSPNSHYIASGSQDRTVQVWRSPVSSSSDDRTFTTYDNSEYIDAVAWSPDGRNLAFASRDQTVRVTAGRRVVLVYGSHTGPVYAIAWSPDGKLLASASQDTTVHIWDPWSGQTHHVYRGHSAPVWALAWSPGGNNMLASGSGDPHDKTNDPTVHIWKGDTGETLSIYQGHADGISALAWSPNGTSIASGSWDTTVHVWQVG